MNDPESRKTNNDASGTSSLARLIGSIGFKLALIVLILIALYFGVTKAYDFGYRIFTQEAVDDPPGQDIYVSLYDDMSDDSIAELLYNKGLIKDKFSFEVFLKLFTSSKYGITTGEYKLNSSMTPKQMIEAISSVIPAATEPEPTLGLYDDITSEED